MSTGNKPTIGEWITTAIFQVFLIAFMVIIYLEGYRNTVGLVLRSIEFIILIYTLIWSIGVEISMYQSKEPPEFLWIFKKTTS